MKTYILKRTDKERYETLKGDDFDAPNNWTVQTTEAFRWLDRSHAEDEQITLAMLGIQTDIIELE
jgi:hypothetical protein